VKFDLKDWDSLEGISTSFARKIARKYVIEIKDWKG